LGPEAEPAIPDLLAFSQGDAFCANLAESALGQIGEAAVGPLSLTLTNEDSRLRGLAAGALAHIGPQAKPAIPALTNCLADPYYAVRAKAARALGRIGATSPGVARALVEALGDADLEVRACAWAALTGFGKSAVPFLSGMLKDADPTVRMSAERMLKEIDAAEQARSK
jgi:HEAT repeat protein